LIIVLSHFVFLFKCYKAKLARQHSGHFVQNFILLCLKSH
jgi:hypothetical protein